MNITIRHRIYRIYLRIIFHYLYFTIFTCEYFYEVDTKNTNNLMRDVYPLSLKAISEFNGVGSLSLFQSFNIQITKGNAIKIRNETWSNIYYISN